MPQRHDLDVRFAKRMKAVRELRNLSQQKLAEASGLGQSQVSKIESHDRTVALSEAVLISRALSVPLDDMIADGEVRVVVVH